MSDKPNDGPEKKVVSGIAMTSQVELLSTSVGKINGETHLILAIRPNPKQTFAFQNFGITKEQAIRLKADLEQLFATSDMLKESEPEKPAKKTRKPRKPKGD